MRSDVIRWAVISGAAFLVLAVIGAVLIGVSGVDWYEDDVAKMLTDVEDNEAVFALGNVLFVVAFLFLPPLFLGLLYAHGEDDRPYSALALIFSSVSLVGALLAGISAIVLTDVASSYAEASGATKEAILADGELVHSFREIAPSALFFLMGLALAISGVLMLRSGFFPRPIAWLTFVVAVGGLSGGFLWPVIWIGLPIWTLAVGVTMWRKSGSAAASALPRPAPA